MAGIAKLDLQERVSYISSATKDKDAYAEVSTPDIEGGALRPGGAPTLFSRESFGLLAQYAAVGLVYGTLPGMVYPFLSVYLNMEGQATTSATALLSIPWSLKVFIGMMSDNFPIFGYRRRPYMILGWAVCALCLFIMAFKPMPKGYWVEKELTGTKEEDWEKLGVHVRPEAPNKGGIYIVFMVLASLGYLISDVAADAVLVEYAQREPEAIRGRTQTAIYTTRTFFSIFAAAIQGFLMNGYEYNGDFSFSLSFANVMLILAIFCVPVIPMTWFFVREEKVARPNFGEYISTLWGMLQSRAFYQIIAYQFFSNVFSGVTYVALYPIQNYWVKATNLNNNLSTIFAYLIAVITMICVGKYGLHWNWRIVIATTMVAVIAVDAVVTMLVTWNVVRSQWFWLGVPLVEQIPSYMQFIVSTYVVVELAGEGNEGACYGLLTTMANLGSPFATTISKNLDASFKVWNKDILADTHEVRRDVAWTIWISYIFKFASLGFLVLLPRQKAETQELKRNGGKSKIIGAITIFYAMFALCWSIMVNLFAIFPSTECLAVTGGCHN